MRRTRSTVPMQSRVQPVGPSNPNNPGYVNRMREAVQPTPAPQTYNAANPWPGDMTPGAIALAQMRAQQAVNDPNAVMSGMTGQGGQVLQRDPFAVDPRSPELQAQQAAQLEQQQAANAANPQTGPSPQIGSDQMTPGAAALAARRRGAVLNRSETLRPLSGN